MGFLGIDGLGAGQGYVCDNVLELVSLAAFPKILIALQKC
jgi:hypothetical protein